MCTSHEGNPFDSARILHRYNTGLIHNLILLLDQILLLDLSTLCGILLGLLLAENAVGIFSTAVGLVATGHSVWLENIVADYTIVMVPGYTVVVPPSKGEVQTVATL